MSHAHLLQRLRETRPSHVVLLADTHAVDQVIRFAEACQRECNTTPLVFVESDAAFTQRSRPSTIVVHGMPAGVIATFAVLDQQGIPARLCSTLDLPGCHDGSVIELARAWLATLEPSMFPGVVLMALGSTSLQDRAQQLAGEFGVHCHGEEHSADAAP